MQDSKSIKLITNQLDNFGCCTCNATNAVPNYIIRKSSYNN